MGGRCTECFGKGVFLGGGIFFYVIVGRNSSGLQDFILRGRGFVKEQRQREVGVVNVHVCL